MTVIRQIHKPKIRVMHGIILGLLVALLLVLSGCSAKETENQTEGDEQAMDVITTASGLQYQDLAVGSGAEAKAGDTVSVHYTGWLEDGTKFNSSLDRNQPFVFTLGKGAVIQGWDEGVAGMQIGGKRRLTIPPDLGYGSRGAGNVIPPNATIIFEVELLGIQ